MWIRSKRAASKGHGKDEPKNKRQEGVPAADQRGNVMTARQRTGTAAAAASPPTPAPTSLSSPWEVWRRSLTAHETHAALDWAATLGFPFLKHLLRDAGESGAAADSLARVLAGNVSALAGVQVEPLGLCDEALDYAQREAVARAIATADVFLLEGLPGAGKTRVLAEILTQIVRKGERVLFVSAHAASLDAALSLLRGRPDVWPLRLQAPDELTSALQPDLAGMTVTPRQQAFQEQIARATAAVEAAIAAANVRRADELAAWQQCLALLDQGQILERERADLQQRRTQSEQPDDIRSGVQVEIEQAQASFNRQRGESESRIRALELSRSQAEAQLTTDAPTLSVLRPLARARQSGRWWTWTWWKSLLQSDLAGRVAQLEEREGQAREALARLAAEIQQLREESARHEADLNVYIATIIQQESERRRESLLTCEQELAAREADMLKKWSVASALLSESERPSAATEPALTASRQAWQLRGQAEDVKNRLGRSMAEALRGSSESLARQLPRLNHLTAAPMDALAAHDVGAFDVLVVEDAQALTEADLLSLAHRACRSILVAEHQPELLLAAKSDAVTDGQALTSRCCHKLWHHLHGDLHRAAYAWSREAGRLCCQLRPVRPEDRQKLEIEHLADFPEVELRIAPGPQPALVQIVFPAEMALSQAKEFIFRELQEVAVQRRGRCAWVREDAHAVVCHLVPFGTGSQAQAVTLETGVRELAHETHSCLVEFDKNAGWTRAKADFWLQQHLRLRDGGRTMFLGVGYRANPALARLLQDLLFPDLVPALVDGARSSEPPLTFVPVPMPQHGVGRVPNGAASATPVWPREGAGMEVDLSAVRTSDRIPSELKAMLPRRGFANYFEAQTIVRALEKSVQPQNGHVWEPDDMALISPFEGQIELLRLLIDRSPTLRGLRWNLGLPAAFRQREYATVWLSLTRSHSHRAVAFAVQPTDLALACTRARERLVIFGDPGNLIKRAGWQGPLEHQGAAAAALEAQRISQFARYLCGQGKHADLFRIVPPA